MKSDSQNMVNRPKKGFRKFWAESGLDWAPLFQRKTLLQYSFADGRADFRAAINIALMAFPQGMAYAMIAGIPLRYGVYAGALATIIGPIFSGSRFLSLGPTNATAVLLLSALAGLSADAGDRILLLPVLTCLVGVLLILGARLQIANLVQYISQSVITGYILGAAALIILNQAPTLLGFELTERGTSFYQTLWITIMDLPGAKPSAALESGLTLIVYFALQRYFKSGPNVALTLVVMSLVALWLERFGFQFEKLTPVSSTNWSWSLPRMDIADVGNYIGAATALALLCAIESISIAKSLAARSGSRVNANQELLGIGTANLICGFGSGMICSGSLTRSALNWKSGARTPWASVITGALLCLGIYTIGPWSAYVPKSSLGALVAVIGFSLIQPKQIRIVSKSTSGDRWAFYSTLGASLFFPLNTAIFVGIGVSLIGFLRQVAAPELVEYQFDSSGQLVELEAGKKRPDPSISIVHVEGSLFFGAADFFQDQIRRVCEDEEIRVLILKMRNARHLDATCVLALEELMQFLNERNCQLLVSEARMGTLRVLKKSGLFDRLGRDHIFPDNTQNPTLPSARALRYAHGILGGGKVKVNIFGNRKQDALAREVDNPEDYRI